MIDGRKLRVPRTSNVLKIKSRDLAEIVALEWAGQEERNLAKIKKHSLYMTQVSIHAHSLRYLQFQALLRRIRIARNDRQS